MWVWKDGVSDGWRIWVWQCEVSGGLCNAEFLSVGVCRYGNTGFLTGGACGVKKFLFFRNHDLIWHQSSSNFNSSLFLCRIMIFVAQYRISK